MVAFRLDSPSRPAVRGSSNGREAPQITLRRSGREAPQIALRRSGNGLTPGFSIFRCLPDQLRSLLLLLVLFRLQVAARRCRW